MVDWEYRVNMYLGSLSTTDYGDES